MQLDIRDESAGSDIVLSLFIENARWATARASGDVVEQMQQQFGRTRDDVAGDLRTALTDLAANELEKVTLRDLAETPPGGLRFAALYVHRDHREVTEGVVWYDVGSGTTGPDAVPALVRNKLRYAVHERLVKGNANAEELLKVFK